MICDGVAGIRGSGRAPRALPGSPPDLDGSGSLAVMIRAIMKTITAVMKTITDKGYAVARPEDYV